MITFKLKVKVLIILGDRQLYMLLTNNGKYGIKSSINGKQTYSKYGLERGILWDMFEVIYYLVI